ATAGLCRRLWRLGPLPPRAGAGRGGLGCFPVPALRRGAGRCMLVTVPPVVAVPVWTVRGRPIDRPGALLAGNPRCCCVRVCQCPVLTGGSGRRPVLVR